MAGAAATVADPSATVGEKAKTTAAAGAEAAVTAAVSAAATPLAGAAVGAVTGKVLRSRWTTYAIVAACLTPVLAGILAVASAATLVNQAGTLLLGAGAEGQQGADWEDGYCYFPGVNDGEDGPLRTLLTAEQSANARTIVSTVVGRGLGARDAAIAVMTALTESSLRNVEYGDEVGPDSRGLFQQRDSWGPLEVRMDPAQATGLFLDRLTAEGLKLYRTSTLVNADESSRATFAPWMVAQSVQISAFANGSNYEAKYSQAVSVVRAIMGDSATSLADPWVAPTGGDGGSVSNCADGSMGELPPSERAGAAIAFARAQIGKPYVWAAAGPSTFDCSGLTMRAYEAAGVSMPRDSRSQYGWGLDNGKAVPLADAQPGDLIFWGRSQTVTSSIYHVAIYLGEDTLLHAPQAKSHVKIAPVHNKQSLMPFAIRP